MEKYIYNYERDWQNELKGHDASLLYDHFLVEQEKKPSFFSKLSIDLIIEKLIVSGLM